MFRGMNNALLVGILLKRRKGGCQSFFSFFLFYLKIYSVLWSAFLQSAFIIVVLRSFQICSIRWLKPRIKNLKVEVQKGNFNISKYMFFRKLSCFWKKTSTTLGNCSVTLKKPTISGRKSSQFPAFITSLKPWNYSRRLRLDVSAETLLSGSAV